MFGISLCMPLREVADIYVQLDAVQDLLDQRIFDGQSAPIAKGLLDLERIVSRVHAKNCKVKDFLKLITVRLCMCPHLVGEGMRSIGAAL